MRRRGDCRIADLPRREEAALGERRHGAVTDLLPVDAVRELDCDDVELLAGEIREASPHPADLGVVVVQVVVAAGASVVAGQLVAPTLPSTIATVVIVCTPVFVTAKE